MKPRYFDLTVADVEAARRFFEACLNWRFVPFGPIPGYYRIQAGEPEEAGIDGGIGAMGDFPQAEGRPLTLMTMTVADVEATIAKVEENGGRVVEPRRAIPGIGWFSACAEPGGLLFGILEPDEGAG